MKDAIMDCHHFEARFEAYVAGALEAGERAACEGHLDRCPACRELLDLADPRPAAGARVAAGAAGAADDLLGRVLEQTSGPACGRAGELLASRLDGAGPGVGGPGPADPLEAVDPLDGELLDLHLAGCEGCRGLARVLAALARDLPVLAEVRPDPAFVDDVLAGTLPATVRWRRALARWWSGRWSAWVRRPRFAWEAAFVLTLACLPVLTSSASPIPPLAETARELAAEDPVARIEGRLERTLNQAGRALASLEAVERAGRGVAAARDVVAEVGGRAEAHAQAGLETVESSLRTLRESAASFLVKAADGDVVPERPEATEETDLMDPTHTRAGDGSQGETR